MADSEYRAYKYILDCLRDLGWDTRNPARGGDVYTQGEFRNHDPFLTEALGKKTPENIALIPWDGGCLYWVIEAKRKHDDLGIALQDAKRKYADKINNLENAGGGG